MRALQYRNVHPRLTRSADAGCIIGGLQVASVASRFQHLIALAACCNAIVSNAMRG
ncbi:hypothetical protein XOCgx_3516 [Xanthomonas oryzae pv. oryzicola]|nr:hypothetical protein XOCgx_3516 [Xanthomonas oryzae pv. oryzicola]